MAPSTLVQDLLQADSLPGTPARVELRTTHGSWVFLTPTEVFKIKRPKDYGFFDYRTLAARKHYCEAEVALNRRGAKNVYLGVLPVRRDARGHSLTRGGEIVDWAVHMRRLPDERSALGLLQAGKLGAPELAALADFAARYYAAAEPQPPAADALRDSILENFAQMTPLVGVLYDSTTFATVKDLQQRWLDQHHALLAQRPCRDGHGDLRLEHAYLLDDGPAFLDCIEFLARFRVADPALDAAFLAMDLTRFGRPDLAETFVARFAEASHDYDLYPLLAGYISYRAMVRAKVAGFVASDATTAGDVAARKRHEATSLLALARDALANPPGRPRLLAVGGIIAAGKSTVAQRLSDAWHAPIVNADATRKHLAGIDPNQRGDAALYTDAFHRRVHDEVLRCVEAVLQSGRPAILDTTLRSRALRDRIRALAQRVGAPCAVIECRVPEAEARRRLRARSGGISDAREDLLAEFMAKFEPMTELPANEHIVLHTTLSAAEQQAHLTAGGAWPAP